MKGALFAFGLLLWTAAAAADGCPPDHVDERARAQYVVDGDTVALADGRRLRIIGVDTPELGRDGRPPQPGAVAARNRLRALLAPHDGHLGLRYDRERRDEYGRALAHAFLPDGTSLTAALLRAGDGVPMVIPPNLWHVDCYQRAAAAARARRAGLWGRSALAPKPAASLGLRDTGYRLVRGRVRQVRERRHAVWVDLDGNLSLRIDRDHVNLFRDPRPKAMTGRQVEVAGPVYQRRGRLVMPVSHPAALTLLPDTP